MTLIIAVAAIVLLAVIGLIAYTRRPRQDAGLTSFRRHIDALSPESRREIMDRVRPSPRRSDDDAADHAAVDGAPDPDDVDGTNDAPRESTD